MQKKIYLASSWRNKVQPPLVKLLRGAGHLVHDFNDDKLITWIDKNKEYDKDEFREILNGVVAQQKFQLNMEALDWADTGVLLLPCGNSAHLEVGYLIGMDKPVFIMIEEQTVLPELMYTLATGICTNIYELLGNL